MSGTNPLSSPALRSPAVLDDPSVVLLDQSVDATPLAFLSKDSLDFSQLPHRPPHHPARLQTEPIKNYEVRELALKKIEPKHKLRAKITLNGKNMHSVCKGRMFMGHPWCAVDVPIFSLAAVEENG
jgi:hypothetical protein